MAQVATRKLCVIQTGRTTWEAQSRIDAVAGAPLTAEGAQSVRDTAAQLVGEGVGAIFAGSGEAESQTAALLAEALGVKVKEVLDLRELDYGLWQGLTTDEIKRRNPKIFRHWSDSPESVRPPGGETLAEAQERIVTTLKGILARQKDRPTVLVLRPVVLGLLRCMLQGEPTGALWRNVDPTFTWRTYEMDTSLL